MTIDIDRYEGFIPFTKIGCTILYKDLEFYDFKTVTGLPEGDDLLKEISKMLEWADDLKIMLKG